MAVKDEIFEILTRQVSKKVKGIMMHGSPDAAKIVKEGFTRGMSAELGIPGTSVTDDLETAAGFAVQGSPASAAQIDSAQSRDAYIKSSRGIVLVKPEGIKINLKPHQYNNPKIVEHLKKRPDLLVGIPSANMMGERETFIPAAQRKSLRIVGIRTNPVNVFRDSPGSHYKALDYLGRISTTHRGPNDAEEFVRRAVFGFNPNRANPAPMLRPYIESEKVGATLDNVLERGQGAAYTPRSPDAKATARVQNRWESFFESKKGRELLKANDEYDKLVNEMHDKNQYSFKNIYKPMNQDENFTKLHRETARAKENLRKTLKKTFS